MHTNLFLLRSLQILLQILCQYSSSKVSKHVWEGGGAVIKGRGPSVVGDRIPPIVRRRGVARISRKGGLSRRKECARSAGKIFMLTTPTNYITLAGTKGGLEPAEPYASYAPASDKSRNPSPSLHPLCEKLSFMKGLGWVIRSTETSVGRCKGGSLHVSERRGT